MAFRLLLVTFDLTGTVPGDRRYAEADATLGLAGTLFKPVKQIRLLLTDREPESVKQALTQRIGRDTTVLVTELRQVDAWRIRGAHKRRREWGDFVAAVGARGLAIQGLSADLESAGAKPAPGSAAPRRIRAVKPHAGPPGRGRHLL